MRPQEADSRSGGHREGGRKEGGDRRTQTQEGVSSWPCDSAGRPARGDQSLPWARCCPDRGAERKSGQPTGWEEGLAAVGWRPGLGMSTVVDARDTGRSSREERRKPDGLRQTDRQTEARE